jgi:hypothetical protein
MKGQKMFKTPYQAELYRNFEMVSDVVTLKSTTYGEAVEELKNIIDKNSTVLGGKLI